MALEEEATQLRAYFTGGVELDDGTDPGRLARFVEDFRAFIERLRVSWEWGLGVELKFRRLGRHRADGLYYPDQRVLVLDLRTWTSFAHEFGHLVDYTSAAGRGGPPLRSSGMGFAALRQLLVAAMAIRGTGDPRLADGRGRVSWGYFSSAPECFARAFEQYAAEVLPRPSSLVREVGRYRSDPLFFLDPPPAVGEYFARLLPRGPEGAMGDRSPGWTEPAGVRPGPAAGLTLPSSRTSP